MAKDPNKAGKMRDELKTKTESDNAPASLEATPEDSAQATIAAAADKGHPFMSTSGVTFTPAETLSKPEAEMLARKFDGKAKEATLPLKEAIDEVKTRNTELQKLRDKRSQQDGRVISELRASDPEGKKTCKRCGYRVDSKQMDSKKELCEVCAS